MAPPGGVTIISCVYGPTHTKFLPRWLDATKKIPRNALIVAPEMSKCPWQYPQAFYLNWAANLAETEWVWISDIDDLPFPDALDGLEDVEADVWLTGFGHPIPRLTNEEYLASPENVYPGSSAFRLEAFHRAGGFPDIAFQDWGLWRRMARTGATFDPSARAHFSYTQHDASRSRTDITPARRAEHLAELYADQEIHG